MSIFALGDDHLVVFWLHKSKIAMCLCHCAVKLLFVLFVGEFLFQIWRFWLCWNVSSHVFTVMVPGSCIQGFKFWGCLRVFLVLYLCFMVLYWLYLSLCYFFVFTCLVSYFFMPGTSSFSVLVSFLLLCL